MDQQQVIVVLGMHRSGTSALSKGLNAMGVDLGDRLIPSSPEENPKGYFEDWDITELNKEILQALGARWDSLGFLPDNCWEQESIRLLQSKAVDLLQRRFGSSPIWGFKDPRTSRLLKFWRPVFEQLSLDDRYVIVFRNPISVANSLGARDGFAPEKSHLLWIHHYLAALVDSADKPRVIVDYDELLAQPLPQLDHLAQFIGLASGAASTPEIHQYATDFLETKLRHSVYSPVDVDLDPAISEVTRRCHRLLRTMTQAPESPVKEVRWNEEAQEISAQFLAMAPLYSYLDGTLGVLALASDRNKVLETDCAQLQNEAGRLAGDLAHARKESDLFRAELNRFHAQKVEMQEQLQQVRGYVLQKVSELDAARERSGELDSRISLLEREQATLGSQIGRRITRARAWIAPAGSRRDKLAALLVRSIRQIAGKG